MGYGVIRVRVPEYQLMDYGVVYTKPDIPFPSRLCIIQRSVRDLTALYKPDEIAFEELFFAKNVKTALSVAAARGVAIASAAEYSENLFEYTPMQVKQALVGYGRADKNQVQQMVKIILRMSEIPKPDDAADAVAVAVTHASIDRFKDQFRMR